MKSLKFSKYNPMSHFSHRKSSNLHHGSAERQLIELTKYHRNNYYQKLARMAKGLPYNDIIKDRYIHDEEREELKRTLIEAAKNGACKTRKEAIKMVSDVVGNRSIDVQFGKTMNESATRRWLIKNGFMMSKPSLRIRSSRLLTMMLLSSSYQHPITREQRELSTRPYLQYG